MFKHHLINLFKFYGKQFSINSIVPQILNNSTVPHNNINPTVLQLIINSSVQQLSNISTVLQILNNSTVPQLIINSSVPLLINTLLINKLSMISKIHTILYMKDDLENNTYLVKSHGFNKKRTLTL
jgi:hypothetical protein